MMQKKSALDYAEHSVVARLASERMLSRLEWVTLKPSVIVDAGCGVGLCEAGLQQRYPDAKIFAFDQEFTFLQYAAQHSTAYWIQGDVLSSPLADHSVDLVFANLLLPWCQNLPGLLREWRRILRPQGLLVFTSLGPDTLREISAKTIPHFIDMHDVGDLLTQGGWQDPVLDVEYVKLKYRDKKKLIQELTKTEMMEEVEIADVSTITYEIIYGLAWSPYLSKGYGADAEGVARIPLSHLRRKPL